MCNAAAVYCAKFYRWGWVPALALMTVACGTYQAFICYAIGLFLFDCILSLLDGQPIPPGGPAGGGVYPAVRGRP